MEYLCECFAAEQQLEVLFYALLRYFRTLFQLRFVVFFHRFSQHFPVCLFVAISQRLRHPQDVCTNLLPLDRVLYFLHGIHLHNFREIGRVVLVELAEPRVVVE